MKRLQTAVLPGFQQIAILTLLAFAILHNVKGKVVFNNLTEYLGIKWSRRTKLLYLSVLTAWVIYSVLLLSTPYPKNSPLNISNQALFFIRLSVVLSYLITWLAATYSFIKIHRYSHSIRKSKEAKGFYLISIGIAVLASSLITATLISAINSRISASSGPLPALVVIVNYCYIFPFLLAFWSFWTGSNYLVKRVKPAVFSFSFAVLSILLIGFMYLWLNLIFTNSLRNSSPAPAVPSTYYLGDSLIVLSIVLPAFVGWFLSLGAVVNLKNYSQKVEGIIYRKAIGAFVWGVWAVLIGSIFLQGLQSLGSIRLVKLGLVKLLLLIYAFLAIQLIGYLYVASGAKKLTKIETV